jgi:hypothetical protein
VALTTVITHATGDVFPASDWNTYLRDNLNYLIVAGANLASAGTITPTNEFHQVTGTTTIDNLTPATPIAGQQVRLLCQSALTIRNNGGGTGNIRTLAGVDRAVKANEIIAFIYDGTVWREAAGIYAGEELGYTEFTSNVSNGAATTEAAAVAVATLPSLTFDGSTVCIVEFYSPSVDAGGGAGSAYFILHDGTNAIGQITEYTQRNVAAVRTGAFGARRFTPAAGTRAYSIRVYDTSGASSISVGAGAGGSVTLMPGFVRLKKAA